MPIPGKRILFIVGSPYRGGAEEYVLKIARAVAAHGGIVDVACTAGPGMASFVEECRTLGGIFYPIEISDDDLEWAARRNRRALIKTVACVVWAVLKARPAAAFVEINWPVRYMGVLLALALLRVPAVVVFQLAPWRHNLRKRVSQAYAWARKRQRWVAVSQENRESLAASFSCPEEEIVLIHNGVPVPESLPERDQEDRSRLLAELGFPETTPLAVITGRIHKQKGYDFFAEAAGAVAAAHPGVRFVWLGDGADQPDFEKVLEQHGARGNVLLAGHRPDVARFLNAADLFVLPSRFEGFSFALLEAAANACPIVTTKVNGIAEFLEDGVHARVVEPEAAPLSEALNWALEHSDDMRRMGQAAFARVQEFTEETMLEKTVALLETYAGSK